jgi:hypothetical protein
LRGTAPSGSAALIRLRCNHRGRLHGPIDTAGEDPAALVSITEDQVTYRWPYLATDAGLHEYACPALPGPTLEECERWAAPR